MDVKTAKAAILVESRKPLIVDEIALPAALDYGQVLVQVKTSSICGAQINETDAVKGVDKFLPHLLDMKPWPWSPRPGPASPSAAPEARLFLLAR
jgi:S-(hydroxymethyl)glutathione dehydrogenase / alcohol dehydrogenase